MGPALGRDRDGLAGGVAEVDGEGAKVSGRRPGVMGRVAGVARGEVVEN